MRPAFLCFAPLTLLCVAVVCNGQQASVPQEPAQIVKQPAAATADAVLAHPPCVTPAHLLEVKEYHGPFAKFAASIANKPNILTTHTPHFHPDDHLCSLRTGEKFHLFWADTVEPVSFLSAGFSAGWAQADNDDP